MTRRPGDLLEPAGTAFYMSQLHVAIQSHHGLRGDFSVLSSDAKIISSFTGSLFSRDIVRVWKQK